MNAKEINDIISLVYSRHGFTLFPVDNGSAYTGQFVTLSNGKKALINPRFIDVGVKPGSHDCLGFHESGRSAWVEGKSLNDRLSVKQREFSALVIANNCFDALVEEQKDGRIKFTERSENNNVFYTDKKGMVTDGASIYKAIF